MSRADVLACTRDDDRLRKWVSDATWAGVSDTKHPLLEYCAGICRADVLASSGDDTITFLLPFYCVRHKTSLNIVAQFVQGYVSTGDDAITLLLCETQNILKYCAGRCTSLYWR